MHLRTVSTRRRFKDNLQGDQQILLKRRLRPDLHAANAKVRNPAGRRKIMGQFTLRIDEQVFDLQTVPGSARIKVRGSDGQVFIFDQDWDRYLNAEGGSDFDPGALGLERELLTTKLHEVVRQRRREVQKINDEPFEPGARAKLFDNGDFRYFVSLAKVRSLAGGYSLAITSQWESSAHPEDEQFRFRACIDRAGLVQLQALIQRELAN
jgi:hypothetical protein